MANVGRVLTSVLVPRRWKMGLLLGALMLLTPPARAATPASEPELRVFVLTMGPGDHPFFKFGHNAVVVQAAGQPALVYNWGTFDFESPTLFTDFLRGRLTYWLSTSGATETVREYQFIDRCVDIQELDLSLEQQRKPAL